MTPPKTILIIGATSGIGYALALAYARAGWRVGATGRRLGLLEQLQQLHPERIMIRQHDVTAPDSVAVLEALMTETGPADVVLYNAGVGLTNKVLDFEPEKTTIDINVTGFVAVATWAYRYFQTRGGGQIVGISSIVGLRGGRAAPAYHASKAFMLNYMEGLRQKARHQKLPLFVTDIRPGYVLTPLTEKNPGLFWVATPEKAARQIMAAVRRRARVAYVTRRWALIALAFRLVPRWIFERG